MKITIWDILSVLLLLGTIIVLVLVVQIFSDPSGGLNPFPPPTLPSRLVLPTYTKTPLRLPATWTPTAPAALVETSTEETPSGLKPTWTLLPTKTGFVVNTWTPTATVTFTPTITRTPTNTRTSTPTSVPFAVTSVLMSVDTSAYSGTCPHPFTFLAGIVVTGSGTVKYHWVFSDGSSTGVQELSYSSGGTQSVSTSWPRSATGNYWAQIYIDEPNHQGFGQQAIAMTCTP